MRGEQAMARDVHLDEPMTFRLIVKHVGGFVWFQSVSNVWLAVLRVGFQTFHFAINEQSVMKNQVDLGGSPRISGTLW